MRFSLPFEVFLPFINFTYMTKLTFDEDINLDKTHFANLEEFQNYLMMHRAETVFSDELKALLDARIEEAENSKEEGKSWEELKAELLRK